MSRLTTFELGQRSATEILEDLGLAHAPPGFDVARSLLLNDEQADLARVIVDLTRMGYVGPVTPLVMHAFLIAHGSQGRCVDGEVVVGVEVHDEAVALRRYEPIPDALWMLVEAPEVLRELPPEVAYRMAIRADARGAGLATIRLLERAVCPSGDVEPHKGVEAVERLAELYGEHEQLSAVRAAAIHGVKMAADVLAQLLYNELRSVPGMEDEDDIDEASRELTITFRAELRERLISDLIELAVGGSGWAEFLITWYSHEGHDDDGLRRCEGAGLDVEGWRRVRRADEELARLGDDLDLLREASRAGDDRVTGRLLTQLMVAERWVEAEELSIANPAVWPDGYGWHNASALQTGEGRVILEQLASTGVDWAITHREMMSRDELAAGAANDPDAMWGLLAEHRIDHDPGHLIIELARSGQREQLLALSRAGVADATDAVINLDPGYRTGFVWITEDRKVEQHPPIPAQLPSPQ